MTYFITRVDHSGGISPADALLSPARWLCGGRSYTVLQDESGTYSHAVSYGRVNIFTEMVQRIIGFLATVLLSPLILVGLLVKHLSSSDREAYGFIQMCTEQKIPMLRYDALSLRPVSTSLSADEVAKLEAIEYVTLCDVWNRVGKQSENPAVVRNQLENWLEKQVPYTSTYTHIPPNELENAKIVLERNLKVIALACADPMVADSLKEEALGRLYAASLVCSPTWVEESDALALLFKKANTPIQKLLRWVQQVKEDLILTFIQREKFAHWHGLNYARYIMGRECGLNYEAAAFDGTVFNAVGAPSKSECLELFVQFFSPQVFIEALTKKIRFANPIKGEENGSDADINSLLAECADEHAKAAGIDIQHKDYDSAIYVLNAFYDKDIPEEGHTQQQKYRINEEGVKQLLIQTGFLGFE